VEGQTSANTSAIATVAGRVTTVEGQTSANTGAIASTSQRVASLDTRVASTESRVTALEQAGGVSPAFNDRVNKIEEKADRALEGVAISLSVADPILRGNEVFGLRVNWGHYGGHDALGVSVVGVLDQNVFGNGEKLAISGGFGAGVSGGHVGGRIGAQLTW
jgi:hypothetical protein